MKNFYKILTYVVLIISLLSSPIYTSANILDDLKNGLGTSKDKALDKVKETRNQAQTELNEDQIEIKKICEIQKGYAKKHFENRQSERSKEIQEKISKINKIKSLFSNNKQDVNGLNITIEDLSKLLKQKVELLNTRVKNASSIDCSNEQNEIQTRSNLREINQKLEKLDKDIRVQIREFGGEAQRLIIKMKESKTEEEKK
jgi:hypothetical protein